jgi:hypothetical protein
VIDRYGTFVVLEHSVRPASRVRWEGKAKAGAFAYGEIGGFQIRVRGEMRRWLGAESNRRHEDFQSSALPTELPSLSVLKSGTYQRDEGKLLFISMQLVCDLGHSKRLAFCIVVVSRFIFVEMLDRVVQLSANDFVVKIKAYLAQCSSGKREPTRSYAKENEAGRDRRSSGECFRFRNQ